MNSEFTKELFLNKGLIGKIDKVIYLKELDSTNKYAKQYLSEFPEADNTLIFTSHQTNGIGRFNRKWYSSPNENLTFTLIKKFNLAVDEVYKVNFYSSYILYITLNEVFKNEKDMNFILKWPNDLLLNNKKVSGFLFEVKDINIKEKTFIIGCGVNVNQTAFDNSIQEKTTSLKLNSEIEFYPENILNSYLKNFYEKISILNDSNYLIEKWRSSSILSGKIITFKKYNDGISESATFEGIGNDGALCLRDGEGKIKKYYSGEITLSV
ncbi:MAG: biotin--[acetyl-CoA-carboxylase] ligase [Ignavibacteria bacterium]